MLKKLVFPDLVMFENLKKKNRITNGLVAYFTIYHILSCKSVATQKYSKIMFAADINLGHVLQVSIIL